MPYVNIKIADGGATTEQKSELIANVTDLLHRVLNKDRKGVVVVIDELDANNRGVGGEMVAARQARQVR